MRILVISLAGIGDTLFATPVLAELRSAFADAQIDVFVVWPGAKDLLEGNPNVNSIYQHDLIHAPKFQSLHYLRTLRRLRYDLSINVHPQSRVPYRIVARIIAARRRLSHDYGNSRLVDRFLVTESVPQDYNVHCAENNLNLLELLDRRPKLSRHEFELYLSEAERKQASDYLSANPVTGKLLLGFHVGSGTTKNLAKRRWPVENFIALFKRILTEKPTAAILLFGGPAEQEAHAAILKESPGQAVFAPATKNLREAAAILQKCHAFVSVDTVFMNLAAAVKVPRQIVIDTPTFNKTVHPYGNPFSVVENPWVAGRHLEFYRYDGRGIKLSDVDLTRCMASVSVDSVWIKLRDALAQS